MEQPDDSTTESNKIGSDSNFIILDPIEYDPSKIEVQLGKSPTFFQYSPTKSIQLSTIREEANETQQTCEIDEKVRFKADEKSLHTAKIDEEGIRCSFETYNDAHNKEEFYFEDPTVIDNGVDVNKTLQFV